MPFKLCTKRLAFFIVSVIISHEHYAVLTQSIAFDEVSSLHIWITVSSLANKDPANSRSLLFRQIELNWINAPLEDGNDYIGLYLDTEPEDMATVSPVSVHKLSGRMNGKATTEYYLPMINFINETKHLDLAHGTHRRGTERAHFMDTQYDLNGPAAGGPDPLGSGDFVGSSSGAGADDKWHQYNTYGGGGTPVVRQSKSSSLNGRHKKSIAGAGGESTGGLLRNECVGYCIAYHSQSKILATNCLRTNPSWMHDTQVSSRSLPSLMIPGTHNSATYPRHLDKTVLQIINKYQINQDESIFNQLVYGIRYLDLRVGYSKVKQRAEDLWVYHDIFRTDVSIEEVFEHVRRFLELTSHEIIIMDFHRFTVGFQNENIQLQRERHAKLLNLLFKHLGQYIIPSYLGQHAPMNEYISIGKRLIVGYVSRSQLLGPQADQHSSMFGLYSAQSSNLHNHLKLKQQQQQQQQSLGDADGLDDNNLHAVAGAVEPINSSEQSVEQQQADRRMGTRIYNKLKSLKLISRSFSKRSAESEPLDREDEEDASDNSGSGSINSNSYADDEPDTGTGQDKVDSDEYSNKMAQSVASSQQLLEQSKSKSSRGRSSAPLILLHNSDHDHADNLPIEEAIAAMPSRLAILFPPIRHLWPNKDTIEGLSQYMNETTCRKYFGELRSMMVELTPTVFGAISDKYDGNRRLADQANRPVTDWIRQRWLHCLNIVASDFFLGNDLIRLSIYANKMRLPQHGTIDLSSFGGQACKSFRRIEHLLDKSKISSLSQSYASHHQHHHPTSSSYNTAATTTSYSSHPDGISDLFSYIKRLFNL